MGFHKKSPRQTRRSCCCSFVALVVVHSTRHSVSSVATKICRTGLFVFCLSENFNIGAALFTNRKQNFRHAFAGGVRTGDLSPAFEMCPLLRRGAQAHLATQPPAPKVPRLRRRPHPRRRNPCSPRPRCPRKTRKFSFEVPRAHEHARPGAVWLEPPNGDGLQHRVQSSQSGSDIVPRHYQL